MQSPTPKTGFRIAWTNNPNARWALYDDPPRIVQGPRGDDIEIPLGTFNRFGDAHDELMRIVGSPHRFDAKGNPL